MQRFKQIMIVFFGILLLSGCTFNSQNNMTINKDGKMIYQMLISFDKETVSKMIISEDENIEINDEVMYKYIDDAFDSSSFEGLKRENYSDEKYIGFKYLYEIDNIDKISDKNIDEVNLNVFNSNKKITDMKLFKKEEKKYSANFSFKLDEDINPQNITFDTSFSVTLPYKALKHNAKSVTDNGKTLNWTIDVTKNDNIKFTFSLTNVNLIVESSLIMISIIIFAVVILIIYKIKNKNKNKIFYISAILIEIIIIGTIIFIYNKPSHISSLIKPTTKELSSSLIEYKDNIITVSYNKLNDTVNSLNKLLSYTESTDELYTNIVDNMMKNDKQIKMYDSSENQKILETTVSKEQAKELIKSEKIENDILLKIIFNDADKDKIIEEIDYKINREQIIRKKIVATALAEVGKTGETYWEWYLGHSSTFMEYCAVFVSWVADKNGQLDNGNVPKFAWVTAGVNYYKDKGWFKYNKDYDPKPGDIVFFNWNSANDLIDHVAFVEKYENGYVYTIEGNVGGNSSMSRAEKAKVRKVVQRKYKKNSLHLYGYGVPEY